MLADQNVVQSGNPLEIYRSPASIEAAHLMSEPAVNILPNSANGGLVQAIRPEHMKLRSAELGEGVTNPLRYQIRVEAVETSGSHTFVQGILHDAAAAESAPRWIARLNGMPNLSPDGLTDWASRDHLIDFFVDPSNRLEIPGDLATAPYNLSTEAVSGAS